MEHRALGRTSLQTSISGLGGFHLLEISFADALAVELKDRGILVCGIYPGGMDTPFWDVQTYHGDRSRIMDPAKVAEMVLAVAVQPQGTLVREVILFPTNEWH